MTPRDIMIISARIKEELKNIKKLENELIEKGYYSGQKNLKKILSGDSFIIRAVASILHDIYVCMENIFKIIAREFDGKVPASENWHKELLLQMSLDIDGVRKKVISRELWEKLEELRGFRHVFRNVYGFNLNEEKILALLIKLPDTLRLFFIEMEEFIEFLQKSVAD